MEEEGGGGRVEGGGGCERLGRSPPQDRLAARLCKYPLSSLVPYTHS